MQSIRVLRLALRQRAELYTIHDPELLPAAVLLRLLTRRPVVYDVHEDVPAAIRSRLWLPRGLRRLTAWLYRFVERLSLPFIAGLSLADHAGRLVARRNRQLEVSFRIDVVVNEDRYVLAHITLQYYPLPAASD